MTQVAVTSFGVWQWGVNGTAANPLPSRMARELLVRVSLADGPMAREQLIDELWPNEQDVVRGRRRLSQELNKIQTNAGVKIWSPTRDSIGLHPDCVLTSDLLELLSDTNPGSGPADQLGEREYLLRVLGLPRRGRFLPGHTSKWSEEIRIIVERHETGLLRRAIRLVGDGASGEALVLARRLAELNPFDDDAHAQVLALVVAQHGEHAARDYFADVELRYRRELGCGPAVSLTDVVRKPSISAASELALAITRLEDDVRDAAISGASSDELAALLVDIDDHVRSTGNINRRRELLAELSQITGDTPRTARGHAEVALASCDIEAVERILVAHSGLESDDESSAWLSLAACHVDDVRGSYNSAMTAARATIAGTDLSEVKIEANLLIAKIAAASTDIHEAEQAALQALALANTESSSYYCAAAQVKLAWIRVRAGDYLSAEQYLSDAIEAARRIGARAIEAEALGAQAYYCAQSYKLGTSLELTRAATAISQENGDIRSEMRWRLNMCLLAVDLGDIKTLREQIEVVSAKFGEYDTGATAVNFEVVETDMFLLERDYERWLARCAEVAQRMSAKDVHYGAFLVYANMPLAHIALGRPLDAVRAAELAIAYADQHGIPVHIQALARASLGAALTASGDPARGIVHLREVMSASQGHLTASHIFIYWLHTAATQLGLVEEASSARAQATELVRKLRSDLSSDQWRTAKSNSLEMQRLAGLAE